jgi:hypothetical protein
MLRYEIVYRAESEERAAAPEFGGGKVLLEDIGHQMSSSPEGYRAE